MILPKPRLLLITDRHQAGRPLPEVVEAACAAGCRWVSVRDKDLVTSDRRRLARELVKIGHGHGATVTLHGDLATAEAARADGVHVEPGTAPGAVRQILGKEVLIGASVHSWDEAERAQDDGADYVTVSPVFETPSKPGYGPAIGLEILAEFCAALRVPVVALGGVTPDTAAACREAGAHAVAVMGEIMRAQDPGATTRHYLDALDRAR
jgi:thiamine-phosphate pyrophosphorylase